MEDVGADDGRVRAVAYAVLAALLVAGCAGRPDLVLALSAPDVADGLTIVAARHEGENGPSVQASYRIEYGGRVVYPPGGIGGMFLVTGESGSQFVPYNFFVEGNGPYSVHVRIGDDEARGTAHVQKWVEYVYLHPYYTKQGRPVLDLQLSKSAGGHPDDRVIARGDLLVEVRYHGLDKSIDTYSGVLRAKTPDDETFTRLDIPPSVLSKGPGWYSFDATFNNDQAKGNNGVENDPTLAQRSPPWNWLYVKP